MPAAFQSVSKFVTASASASACKVLCRRTQPPPPSTQCPFIRRLHRLSSCGRADKTLYFPLNSLNSSVWTNGISQKKNQQRSWEGQLGGQCHSGNHMVKCDDSRQVHFVQPSAYTSMADVVQGSALILTGRVLMCFVQWLPRNCM